MDLISVIIPVYNVEKYLNKCVNSILKQTYCNLEIVLVDDGSTDNCSIICDDLAKIDRRIKVIHQKNSGLSAARNSGINIAKGEYLCFIDSDDYVEEKYIELLYLAIKKANADMSICEFYDIDDKNNIIVDKHKNKLKNCTYTGLQILMSFYKIHKLVYIVAWNKLYKKDLFHNLRYKEGKIHEDEFIIHRLLFKSKKVVCIEEPLYYYLRRSNSIMGSRFNLNHLDYIEALEDRIRFFEDNNIPELIIITKCKLLYSIAIYFGYLSNEKNINKLIINFYKNKYRKIFDIYFNEVINSNKCSLKEYIIILLFYISPSLIKCLTKIKKIYKKYLDK